MAPADAAAKEGGATVTTGSLVWVRAPPTDASDRAWLKAEVLKVAPGGATALVRDEDGREVEVDASACPLQNPAARMGVEVRKGEGAGEGEKEGGARPGHTRRRSWPVVGCPARGCRRAGRAPCLPPPGRARPGSVSPAVCARRRPGACFFFSKPRRSRRRAVWRAVAPTLSSRPPRRRDGHRLGLWPGRHHAARRLYQPPQAQAEKAKKNKNRAFGGETPQPRAAPWRRRPARPARSIYLTDARSVSLLWGGRAGVCPRRKQVPGKTLGPRERERGGGASAPSAPPRLSPLPSHPLAFHSHPFFFVART